MEKTERVIAIFRFICLVLTGVLLCGTRVAQAETAVGGAIVANTTWTSAQGPYLVTSDVSIESGAVLSVEAGVTVFFQSGRRLIVRNGALHVAGTAASPVLFTSALNVPSGTPANGDWGGVQFLDGTLDGATVLEHLTISYGSTTALYSASPTFNNCRFERNSGYALSIDLASFPHGSGNSATGNGFNAIQVAAGEMTTSGAWDFTAIPYFLDGVVSVGAAPTLSGVTPSSIEQASSIDASILGTRLNGATKIVFGDPTVTAAIQAGGTSLSIPVKITALATSVLGPVGLTVSTPAGDVSLPSAITVTPPLPAITSVTPNTLFVSRPTTTISITGINFTADSVVYLAGTALTTTFVSATQLNASVPSQSIAVVTQVQVKNPDPRSPSSYLTSNGAPFTVVLPQFTITPSTLTVRQGTNDTLTLSIPFAAPVGGITAVLTSTNTAAATVPATATIAEGATSVAVTVTAPDTATNHDVALEVHANQNNWLGNKASVTVRPHPTVNLSPPTLLSGQGFTFFLSINLTDPAPAGGLVVTLTASPANILTLPASVTVPEGATVAQVTVANTGIGAAVISGIPAAGAGFISGDTCSVTVRAVQTTNITPLVSPVVGVNLAATSTPISSTATYSPLVSRPVGVSAGPTMTGMTPDRAPVGTQNLLVRVNGSGFASDSSVMISPAMITATLPSGVSLRSDPLVVAADGSYVEFRVDIAADAPVSERIVTVTSSGKAVPPASVDANRFKVTWPTPEIWSLAINSAVVNTTLTLQLSGTYFQGATAIAFEPAQGIQIGAPISVSPDGTSASVPVFIAPDAAPGNRAVWITTPGGSTSATMQTGNVFEIRAVAGTTYTPIVSAVVGVALPSSNPVTSRDVTYSPLVSSPVGVSLGSVITGVVPISGAIGTTDLRLRVTGVELSAVDSFTIEPNTGLTITRPVPPVAADGSWAEALVTIAEGAPLTQRTVILKAGAAVIPAASAEANRFRVTLPMPEMTSIFPNRSKAGSSFTFTVNGRLLNGATAISFSPPDGITVSAPAVSSDGNSATAAVTIDAGAARGTRVVTITTPGGTTSSTASFNIFEVVDPTIVETTYTPVVSLPVGITVAIPPPTSSDVSYGPIVTGVVGIAIPLPAPVATHDVTYTPVVSRPVGVAVGAVMTGMTPAAIEPGTTRTITFTGTGLDAVTSLQILPADGLTLGTPVAAADGRSLTIDVTADAAAPRSPRAAVLGTAAGVVTSPVIGPNLLYVGLKPTITSLDPSLQPVGTSFTLTVNGYNLDGATAIRFEPPDGITVMNPPAVNASGNIATVSVIIDAAAAGSQRVVVIEGPYGSSGNVSGANNTFTVYQPPVVSAPAPVRWIADCTPQKHPADTSAGSADVPRLVSLMVSSLDAIPVARKPLALRSLKTTLRSLVKTESGSMVTGRKNDDEISSIQIMSMLGWGYRAPPRLWS